MFYTRKGDKGDTSAFGSCQRFSKASKVTEALGALDELNSFLGICKISAKESNIELKGLKLKIGDVIEQIQQNLFMIQANIAGADKKISKEKILEAEKIIDDIEKQLPPIKTFFIPGGSELSAMLDYSRTIARRAERRTVAYLEEKKIDDEIIFYLNRLSSLLYALARFVNLSLGVKENSPKYENL